MMENILDVVDEHTASYGPKIIQPVKKRTITLELFQPASSSSPVHIDMDKNADLCGSVGTLHLLVAPTWSDFYIRSLYLR